MSMSKEELIIGFFEKGYCCDLDEVKNTCLDLLRENQKYKEVIDKAIELLNNPWSFESGNKEVDEITHKKKCEIINLFKEVE